MKENFEGLGDAWATLVPGPDEIRRVLKVVMVDGKTRSVWKKEKGKNETFLLAWPQDEPFRAAVIMTGEAEKTLAPATCTPFMAGLPNDLVVRSHRPWKNKREGMVNATRTEKADPLWFYNPLYFRDEEELTEGVTHTFELSALAYGVRRALIDELTISAGPQYEAYATQWLQDNPDKSRLDVPQLKMPLKGARILAPAQKQGDYQVRVPLEDLQTCPFGPEVIYMTRVCFDLKSEHPLEFMLYISGRILKDLKLKAGDEIDAIVWLQGHIMD